MLEQYGRAAQQQSKKWLFKKAMTFALLCISLFGTSCSEIFSGKPKGAFLGRTGLDDYSPSAIQIGNLQQFWWCGQGHNPENSSQDTDTILYSTSNPSTKETSVPIVVLGETPGAWDSVYTCNPKVIGGVFNNPLGDSKTYSYAMYYVGTASQAGISNGIGVAFSNDGVHWKKYPKPVIPTTTQAYYGIGQPAVYNSDGKSGIWIFYEDLEGPSNGHYEATSTDGVHFTTRGEVTTKGLDQDLLDVTWGDMAYDSAQGWWYAAFNMPRRDPSTTGNVLELGQMGIALYRIPGGSILTGTSPWVRVASFDTNLTGHEANFLGGFLRDKYGNVNVGPYPIIEIVTSMSNPVTSWDATPADAGKSGGPDNWDLGLVQWASTNQLLAFNRYKNGSVEEVTTGWIDPAGGFTLQSVVGHLYSGPQQGATVAIYGCKSGSADYFVATDRTCGGSRVLGVNGYAYPTNLTGSGVVPLYSCSKSQAHFVSHALNCEGAGEGSLLGYALP